MQSLAWALVDFVSVFHIDFAAKFVQLFERIIKNFLYKKAFLDRIHFNAFNMTRPTFTKKAPTGHML